MPVSNEYCDLHDYPSVYKWRRFDDINTIAVEFIDGTIRLYPVKIFEIHHPHVGYGGYQELCGEMFKTIRISYRKRRSHYKDTFFVFKNRMTFFAGMIYHYGISFDGFNSIDELTEEDVIRIAAADGLDLLSPPSYGPGGMTKSDLMTYYKLAYVNPVQAARWLQKNGFPVHPADLIEFDDPNDQDE